MKTLFCLPLLAGLLVVAGCCAVTTPESVAQLQGQGLRRSFEVSYETVWTTTRSVAVMNDLQVINASKITGYISARRGMGETTFGDVYGIWIRPVSPNLTEVEVVSRRVGAPVPFAPNPEKTFLKSLDDVLTF